MTTPDVGSRFTRGTSCVRRARALARRGERGQLLRDACMLNLFMHPLAISLPDKGFLATELAFTLAHAAWYLRITELTWRPGAGSPPQAPLACRS